MSDEETGDRISRRALLGRVGAAGAFVAIPELLTPGAEAAQSPRPAPREPIENLTPAEADTLDAIVARLIPSDAQSPGATEARAATYIDRAIGGALAWSRPAVKAGLASTEALALATKQRPFTQLTAAEQDELLGTIERNAAPGFEGGSAPFFATLLNLTWQGTFGDPFYGGNRNFAGWDLLGYPGVRLAVTGEQQNLDAKLTPTHMGAYDYSMFSRRRPNRASGGTSHDTHGD